MYVHKGSNIFFSSQSSHFWTYTIVHNGMLCTQEYKVHFIVEKHSQSDLDILIKF